MDKFEQHSNTSNEEKGSKQEQLKGSDIINRAATTKKIAESSIEVKTKTVQNILNSLEVTSPESQEVLIEEVVSDPEEILNKVKDEFNRLENPSIDDVSRILITSRSEVRNVQNWLSYNQGEIQSLNHSKENLRKQHLELSQQLMEEMKKHPLVKLFRGKERQVLDEQLNSVYRQETQTTLELRNLNNRSTQIETTIQKVLDRRQELAINATEQLFQEVVEGSKELKEKLTSPEIIQELNDILISKEVTPVLKQAQEEGKITKEESEEYVTLLKIQLSKGSGSRYDAPIEETEATRARWNRLYEIDQKSGSYIGDRVSIMGEEIADKHYDGIFYFLIKNTTQERIEQLHNTLSNSTNRELQEKLGKISEKATNTFSDWLESERRWSSYKDRVNKITQPDQLEGLERWSVVKSFMEPSGVIPEEVFKKLEREIIQTLFDEYLHPSGHESSKGTAAAVKMGALCSPEALPFMLYHVEIFGPGHTTNTVVYVMEQIIRESNPTELQQVFDHIPKNKKILMETLVNKNSYMSRFGKSDSRYDTCYLLQKGDIVIAREKLTKILEDSEEFNEEQLKTFYLGDIEGASETLEALIKARAEVEKIIIESKLNVWTHSADRLLAALVNPRNGKSVLFPKRIAQEGLGISDEKVLDILDKIFETKSFRGSGFEREAFLDGLILLNSKENGKNVLETLLGVYRGAKNDPSRMRRVLQLLSTLDGFNEYKFAVPSQNEISKVHQKINELQIQYSQTQDKTERKKIKNKIETLENDIYNLTGLKGIEDVMTNIVVETACRRLELPKEYQNKIEDNLDEFLKSGLFEIVPSLAGKYEGKNEIEVKNLLRVITAHIIEGDFKSWRYTHEQSKSQLAGLTDEQKEFWKASTKPITINIELLEDKKERREDELRAAQEIIKNAKEHILISQPDFDFSKERADLLTTRIRELTEQIKLSTSEDDKKQLALQKRAAQSEANLINGILEIENETPQTFTRNKILTQARELQEKIRELNIPLAELDIKQIEKIFTIGDIQSITVYESDDAITLLNAGVEPQETCQSWRNGSFNECLLSYVADSNKKVLNVVDEKDRIVARSIMKLTHQRDVNDFESKTQRNTILAEKPYSLLPNPEVYRSLIRILLTKAQEIDASVTLSEGFDEAILKVFKEEAQTVGYDMSETNLDIFIPRSINTYEYSDCLGGKISWFETYRRLEAITFEKPQA